jgi:hypothetical protein
MRKIWIWLAGLLAILIILVVALAFFIDEPLRGYVERKMNQNLNGYTVRIGALDFQPLRFATNLKEVTISQDANPDPPIVHIPKAAAGVQWRELLSARVVGDVLVEQPTVHINLKQIRSEAVDGVPVHNVAGKRHCRRYYPLRSIDCMLLMALSRMRMRVRSGPCTSGSYRSAPGTSAIFGLQSMSIPPTFMWRAWCLTPEKSSLTVMPIFWLRLI